MIHLEALGAVLRSTALLEPIRRKYPKSHITWVTAKPSDQLLKNNPFIDRVLVTSAEDLLVLAALEFDVAFVIDKGLKSIGVLRQTKAREVFGFVSDPRSGAILPATTAARELWDIGLSDQKKFFENTKTENHLIAEALEVNYLRDDYQLVLTSAEQVQSQDRRKQWAPQGELIIGLNTGCSTVIPYKKMSVEGHERLIKDLRETWPADVSFVLLGGPEDTLRNQQIAARTGAINSPSESGLRDGLISMAAADIVISGDSLGMHMAIALKKWVVAWFGPTCAHEIELYGRGVKVLSKAPCGPCWKRHCQKATMCYDLVDHRDILLGIQEGILWLQKSSSIKPPSGEISFSQPPSFVG